MPACGSFRKSVPSSDHPFEFMGSSVSTEKPKGVAIRADRPRAVPQRAHAGGKTLLVGGPAIIHTGSGEHVCQLIRDGYINVLFAGNALATHDIEQALFGTSLGVHLDAGHLGRGGPRASSAGHQPHPPRRRHSPGRATRAARPAGIMYECVKNDVDFLLAGSIRDDGPLPEVITDMLEAQRQMRETDSRRDFLPDDRHHAALDCGRQSAAGLGQSRVRRYQSFDRHQAQRSRLVSDRGPGDRRRAVPAGAGAARWRSKTTERATRTAAERSPLAVGIEPMPQPHAS